MVEICNCSFVFGSLAFFQRSLRLAVVYEITVTVVAAQIPSASLFGGLAVT